MTDFTEQDETDFFAPGSPNGSRIPDEDAYLVEDDDDAAQYEALFDVPDFATLIRESRSAVAHDYEKRVKTLLKTGAISRLRKGNLADAAAIFEYGPSLAATAGDLAERSETTRKAIDLLTSPDNPYFAFALVAFTFAGQLLRNREPAIQRIQMTRREIKRFRRENPEEWAKMQAGRPKQPKKNLEIKLPFGRKITLGIRLRVNPMDAVRFAYITQTHEPSELVERVFSDPKLRAALKKQKINIVETPVSSR